MDVMIEINCIPPRLNMWYKVIYIGGIVVLLTFFLSGTNETYDFFISFPCGCISIFSSNFKNEDFHFKFQK
jgi:hypothetical protein